MPDVSDPPAYSRGVRKLLVLMACFDAQATAQTYLGQKFNAATFGPCVQYGCKALATVRVNDYGPARTERTFQLKKRDVKLTVTVLNETGRVIGIDALVLRSPVDLSDEAVFLGLIQKSAGGMYRPEVISRCYDKLAQTGGDSGMENPDGFQEELMLARDHIGVKCFTKAYGNSEASGIRIFFGD